MKGVRPDATIDDVSTRDFYGRYDNSVVLLMFDIKEIFFCPVVEYKIADLVFCINRDQYIFVYNKGRLFYLWNAYEKGIITYADLCSIYKIYNGYNDLPE